jgi:hypothetical protein
MGAARNALGSGKARRGPLDGCVASAAYALIALLCIGKNMRGRKVGSSRIERWSGRIFDAELYRLGELVARNLSQHRERKVDTRCDATASKDVAVPYHSRGIGNCPECGQCVTPGPV